MPAISRKRVETASWTGELIVPVMEKKKKEGRREGAAPSWRRLMPGSNGRKKGATLISATTNCRIQDDRGKEEEEGGKEGVRIFRCPDGEKAKSNQKAESANSRSGKGASRFSLDFRKWGREKRKSQRCALRCSRTFSRKERASKGVISSSFLPYYSGLVGWGGKRGKK